MAGLTALHVAYRWVRTDVRAEDAVLVSDLVPGAVVPALEVEVATPSGWVPGPLLDREACQVLVAFDPACPFCMRAAREASRLPPDRRPMTTWVTDGKSPGVLRYREQLGDGVRMVRSDEVVDFLEVRGVPAAYLVDDGGTVRHVWPYRGIEDREELEPRCHGVGAPAGPPGRSADAR
jgi:hypothetical protein